jgi:hypothetical protein
VREKWSPLEEGEHARANAYPYPQTEGPAREIHQHSASLLHTVGQPQKKNGNAADQAGDESSTWLVMSLEQDINGKNDGDGADALNRFGQN